MSARDTRGAVSGAAESSARAASAEAAAKQPVNGLAIWAQRLAVDVAVGLMWALLLAAAVLFISGVSQFIYVAF